MQDDLQRAPRFPWGDFPDVLRNGNLGELKQQPEYAVAKAGGNQAALDLVDRVLRPEFVDSVRHLGSKHERPVLLPVLAAETSGNNRIPLMLAYAVAHRLDWPVDERIVQITRAWHTDSGADHRLVVHPEFAGPVDSAAGYILIDDTLTMGGTIADLRGFIMSRGGHVLGASVAVAHEGALHLPLRDKMRDDIFARHGKDAVQEFAYEEFGYGIECLTQGEAGHIRKAVSLDALRDRFAAARDAHSRRLGESRAIPPLSEQGDAARPTDSRGNRGVKARRERDARILSKAVSRDEGSAEDPLTHRNLHPPPETPNRNDSLVG